MSAINDKSISDAIAIRELEIARGGCLQGRRMLYGVKPCFDDIIRADLELHFLNNMDIDDPVEPPEDPVQPAQYTPPSCGFAFDLVDEGLPEGLRNGRLVLVPGYTYTADVVASFTQNDAGTLQEIEFLRNGAPIPLGAGDPPYAQTDQISFSRSVPGNLIFGTRLTYAQGPVKNDGEGNPDPSGQIQAGSITCGNKEVIFDFPVFWGLIDAPENLFDFINLPVVDSKFVQDPNQISLLYDNIGNPNYFWFAVPETYPVYTNWFESINNQGTINNSGDFLEIAGVGVPMDIGGGNIQTYTVYISAYPTEGSGNYIMS